MADVFVSYARSDKARVAPLVAVLEARGWSVWWDPAIAPGQEFDQQIAAELKAASAVLVVWTPDSVRSRWVRGEARDGADRGILVPVRFDRAELPIDVRALHTIDLDDWGGDASSPPLQDVLRALHDTIARARSDDGSVVRQGASASGAAAAAQRLTPHAPPAPLTALIGRDTDLKDVVHSCREHRLVTIVGPGGIGKTRLALEAARELATRHALGPVAFSDLTPLKDGSLVAAALAEAAGVVVSEGDPTTALLSRISNAVVLFLVDNAEHVSEAVADAVSAILSGAPNCRVLVTSQVPLDMPGEWLHRLEPLPLPSPDATLEEAAQSGAIALFIACARAADRHFALTAENVGAVVESCRRLDGIPLALQLAAARIPQLGAAGLAARLDQRFRLLARASGTVPSRQRTLAAALDWSFHLLEPLQQAALRRIGVFVGTFDLADACAIATSSDLDDWQLTDAVGQLVDRSLLVRTEDEPPRYRLLETVRMYALERLLEAGETGVIESAIAFHEARADRASAQSRTTSAAIDYATAIELCSRLPAGAARDSRELALQLKLGPAVQASSSPGCPRCEAIYGRAVQLAGQGGDDPAAFQALWGYWQFLAMAGRDREAAPLTEQLGILADRLDDDGYQLEACHARFSTAQLLGDARATLEHTQNAIKLYVPERHHALTHAFGGHDPGVCALGQGSVALWLTGQPAQALAMAAEAQRVGASFEHAYTQAVGYYYAAMTYSACGEVEALTRAAEALINVSDRHSMAVLLVEGRLFAGRAAFERGDLAAGVAQLSAAYEEITSAGDFGFVPFYATMLVDARLATGDRPGAEAVISQALDIAEAGQGFFVPELHRLRGVAAALDGKPEVALQSFRYARAMAEQQGALSLALRAATSESRTLKELDDPARARVVITAALAAWDGALQTRDLHAARQLAAELESA